MTNGDRGWQLMEELVRSIAREYGWNEYRSIMRTVVHIDPSILDSLTGTYGGYLISRYFFRDVAIEINFDLTAEGRAAGAEFITPMVHNALKRTQ